jgi:type I restriction enzyme, S subunit
MSEWKTYRLGELVDPKRGITYGVVQPGEFLKDEGVPILKVNNLTERKYSIEDAFRISTEVESKYERSRLVGNEILVSLVGSLGHIYKVKKELIGWNVVRAIGVLPIKVEFDKDWIYWFMKSPDIQREFQSQATTTVQATLNLKELRDIEIKYPETKTRESITSILSSLDEKIELNLQMNQTLETMAQAIFKEWFVNFNFPKGLNYDSSDLHDDHDLKKSAQSFNHKNHGSDKLVNGLPRGWRMGKISDFCKVNVNTLNAKDDISQIHYIEISEVDKGVIKNIAVYKRGEEPSRAKRKLSHGDVVLSTVRPNRGSYFLAIHPDSNLIASTGFAVFTPTKVPFSFLYCLLTSDEQIEYYGRMADGAAYPAINPAVIMDIDFVIPSDEVLEMYNNVVENFYDRINDNLDENKTLTQIRDSLLPKLMTGKIEIKA